MKKRIISFLLAFVMLVGMLPVQAFATGQGQVRVIVENTTYTADEGAPWDGTLVDTNVDLTDNMTMMSAILTALDNAGHTWNYGSDDWDTTYISSIEKDGSEGLAEFDGGTGAGWKGTLNDWFVNLGFADWKVSNGTLVAGDVIRVMYTQDMGADIGGEWGTNVGNLSSLTVSEGKLSPSFDKETLDYTLTVESDVSSVDITAVAENKEDKVTVTVGGTEYRRGVDVPVSDGTEISVACGAKTYLVTVSAAQPEPVTYAVTLPAETTGYTVVAAEGSVSPVVEGGSYSFTVTIADGYEAGEDFAVKANDVVLTAADGVYTIESITADQIVTVEGVAEKVAEEAVPFSTEIKLPSNGNSSWGYVSKLVFSGTDGSIYEAYWSATSNPFVLDVILGQDTDKDATITAAFSVAGLRAPSITGETAVTLQDGKGAIHVTAKSAIASFYPDTNWTINLTVDDGSAANRASYTVTLPESCEAYTVTASSSSVSPVIEGRSYSFTVTIPNTYKAGENFAVKANDVVLEAVNGVYTIENIQADQVVTVEGVEEKTLAELNVTVIAPAGSTISSGRHYSYFKYDFSEPLEETTVEDGRIQKVYPTQSGRQGFVRVQHPEGVTYWDFDGLTAGSVFEITEEMLFIGSSEFGKETVYANFEKNIKDKADLYLTANEKGWLDLNTGDTWNLNVFRNFLSLGNTISNDCLALPDVEYKVISPNGGASDVVSVTPDANNSSYAEIKAEKAGTAIILVSYDAVYNNDGEGGKQWSAIWPENTGVIIVTVDAEDASIASNMTVNEEANSGGKQVIDAEHDILFYVGDSGASYSFKPEAGCTVTVNRSKVGSTMTFGGFTSSGVEIAADGTVTVTGLTTGAHVIKVEKDGKAVYQVVRARQVSYEVKHSDGSLVTEESPAQPAETVTVQFHDLISPLEKLSGVYNANFGFYYNGQQGVQVRTSGGTYGVYTFSGSEGLQKFTVTVPAAWNETTYTLTDGGIKLGGFGGSFGSHRTTTYIAGKEVNTNASGTAGVAAVLPDVEITTKPCGYNSYVATLSAGDGYTVNGMSGEANPIREGDTYTFTVTVLAGYDGENMVVKANGLPVTASDGTYAVENVTENLNITVEGVEKIEVDMTNAIAVYTNGVDGSEWGRGNYVYVDTISLGGAEIESYTWDDDTCNIVLKAGTAKNAAIGFNWAVGGSNASWYDQMSAKLNGTAVATGETVGVKLVDGSATVEFYAIYGTNSRWSDTKTFVITAAEPPAFGLSDLELAVGGNTADTAAVQALTPEFDTATTEYSTPILDYESDKNNRFVLVKVTAPEGATVTAKCGGSEVATLVSGEWGVLQVKGGYFWSPTYSGCLTPGEYNKVEITVSKEGETDKVYTVTVPMQPDIANRSLAWKTNLSEALYITKNDENAALTVEAQYKNRPLENEDAITYQWYSNTSATTEGGTAIAGATAATYVPDVSKLGTGYYYAVASCKDLESITSKVITVTVTDEAAPKSISVVCDYPYTVPNDWGKALGGVSFVAKNGDTLTLKAVDENGKETPVVWPSSLGGGSLNVTNGSTVVYTVTSTIYSYVQVTSLYDSTIQSEEKAIQVEDYSVNQYNKTPTVTLSDDGQSAKTISAQGGLNGYTIWSYTVSPENAAELSSDQKEKANYLKFNALRPGTIQASFDLDLNGDGVADGNGQTDTATLTINGIAVEDSSGNLTKTYLETSTAKPDPTMQLKALSSTENPVFTWSSVDETVATVDENGVVTAKGVGSVIISATDGTYTGGIKVVVTSADTPYFESIDFVTTSAWSNGLSNASWKTVDFKATTLQYTGLKLTKAAASTLTLKDTTLYNAEKYTASATYIDANGTEQSVVIHSGAATELKDLPFETNIITITLTDKADETKKTVYTFEVTRPRDTTNTIANNGIVFVPDGREIWKDKYDGKTEGIMYVANEDGSFAQYQGVSSSRLYYRTYALNGLESFSLTLKGSSAFTHIRISTDDGATWKYLGQTGASGVSTGKIAIPTPTGEEHSVVKVTVQILDDVTYAANVAAGKDGFADSEPNAYTLWVEQIPAPDIACDMETAVTDIGDWYPAFHKDRTSYRIIVAPGAAAPVLTFTVSEGTKVTVAGTEHAPNEKGEYTLTLSKTLQEIAVAASDGMTVKTYSIGYSEREASSAADKVVDYLMVNSQYINGNAGGYGTNPQQTLTGGLLSLGNFGGYVTFYMENGLTDDPNNAYGVDFYVNGNAFKDVSTGTGLGSMEPGQVWVSEDGNTWYALAGSEHYEDSTLWDYAVTYTKTETGSTDWKDNQGNTMASTHGRSFAWPSPDVYTMNDLPKQSSFTLTGILLPCVDGTITGTDNFNAFSKGGRFGYVDLLPNGTSNPYLDNSDYSNASSGFDLAWAVDAAGNPVDVADKSFHYVKVVTASNLMAGSANEKSTEVGDIVRATAQTEAVGVTAAPSGVTISSGDTSKTISFIADQQIYEMDLGDMDYVSVLVDGTAEDDNIYVNNQRVVSGTAATGIKIGKDQKLVRIIVQNGDKEPVIYVLKLSGSAEPQELIEGIQLNVDGAGRLATTTDGKIFTGSIGYRVESIGITPKVVSGAEVTINDETVQESYKLEEGENTFTITASKDGLSQTVTLKVEKEKTPESTGKITVYFALLGDSKHGQSGTAHTLAENNLTTWLSSTAYEIDSPAAVVDLIAMVLKDRYTYVNSGGNYISSVNGLAEFDNGPNSGWMYTINGIHSQQGIAEQLLQDGDSVILHYSDDWTLEHNPDTGDDEAAANAVEALIDAIGTVTLDSEQKIAQARAAYDALTATQKTLVENLAVLEAAEEALALLKLAGTDFTDIYKTTGDYLAGLTAPTFGTTNGEWRVIGLARAGRAVADSYYDAVVQYVKDNIDGSGRLHAVKSTDNSRLIVALTAIGKDVTDVGGYNLLAGLNEMEYIGKQGINGTIWALIAFDTHDYEIPAGDVTREKLVQTILDDQKTGGGWALSGTVGDPDMTGMALQALAPYYSTNSAVKTAVDKALTWLSGIQNKNGTFSGSEGTTSESLSQIITGLTALGINPETDSRFVKNGVSAVDALAQFYVEGGGFKHILAGDRNMMATEQGYYALVSYYRLLQDKTALYDMSDVTIQTAAMDQEAADAVEALIDAIGTVTKDSGEKIKAARDAYDALTDAQKALVENYKTLTDAEAKYAQLVKTAEDEAAAKAVEDQINGIGTVTLNSEAAIKEARAAYEKLTSVQKALVSNLDKLEAAEKALADLKDEAAANEVEKLIDAIGTVTLGSEDKIKAARAAYDALTEKQKKLVENYKKLTDAESRLQELKSTVSVSFTLLGCYKHGEDKVHTLAEGNLSTWIAKKTYMVAPGATVKDVLEKALTEAGMSWRNPTGNYVESINGIGEFTNGSNSGWMYTLNGTHPGLGVAEQTVKDGDVIVFHYTDDYTKEESSQGFADRDEAAAEKVEKLIDAIGTVTLNSKDKIDAACKAYDALTYTQKQMVDNYATLTAAESKYAQLKKDADEAAAKKVEDMIDALDSNSATFEDDVKAAKKAYDALTADQKKLVGNYQKLADALKELASEADKKAAEAVEKLIDAIGTVTKDSEAAIKAAREAYDKLTDEQKALVGNLDVLEAAEEKLAALKTLVGIEDIYKATGDYLEKLGTPVPGTVGGEWMVIGLIRSGREVPDAYYENAVKFVQENIDESGRLHSAKSTENSRMILALTAIGKDVTNVGGHNLLSGLTDMAYVQKQGINGPIWALIAFDSGNYPIPEGGDVTREALIQVILDAQLSDGGWALSGSTSDADITGMALQALAPYYKTDAKVRAAVDEALETLSVMQTADGSFGSIDGVSAESVAQVVAGLSALGIDAHTDARFIKNGVSAIDALCAFYVEGGGFKHIPGGSLDGMATEQSYYSLTAYFRMLDGKTALYDMTDVIDMGGDVTVEEPVETLPAETEPALTEPVETPEKEGRSFPWWLVIVIVVLAGAIMVLVIISGPKKGRHMK